MVVLALHLLAAAAWAGGLIFLGLAAGVARRTIPDRERIAFFRAFGRRFLAVAAVAALVLAATGVHLADERLGGLGDLGGSHDGRLILAKTVLFALALACAALHSFLLGPRTGRLRAALLDSPNDQALAADLRRTATLSGALSAFMLAATLAIFLLAADLGG